MSKMPSRHRMTPDANQVDQSKLTPRTRPVHASRSSGQLEKADPKKKYVMVSKKAEDDLSYVYYKSIGFDFEKKTKDGVRIFQGTDVKEGDPLEWRGLVLMSCSLERAHEIFMHGPSGSTGQVYQDKVMQKIKQGRLEKRVDVDGLIQNEMSDTEDVFR
jgi:hypothetical protein